MSENDDINPWNKTNPVSEDERKIITELGKELKDEKEILKKEEGKE